MNRRSSPLVASFVVMLCLGDGVARADDPPVCEAKPIAAARGAAQKWRDAGDPAGAWSTLKPFVDLDCLGDLAERPSEPERQMHSAYAWLLNDAYVDSADERFGRGQPDSDACPDLLQPRANEDLVPRPWMSPALRQATIANIKACAHRCIAPGCIPFKSTVFATYTRLAGTFRKRDCSEGAGQALDDGRCIALRGKAGIGFVWSDHIKTDLPTDADARAYCPVLYLRTPGGKQEVRLDLPERSATRDVSLCCAAFELKVKPGTDEFMILTSDAAPDCNGGTARTIVEEIYRLPPAATAPILVRDNTTGLH